MLLESNNTKETIQKQKILKYDLDKIIDSYNSSIFQSERNIDRNKAYKLIDKIFPIKDNRYQNEGWKTYFDQIVVRK